MLIQVCGDLLDLCYVVDGFSMANEEELHR